MNIDFITKSCFVNTTTVLLKEVSHKLIRLRQNEKTLFNPSICTHDGYIIVSARESNYRLNRDSEQPVGVSLNDLENTTHLFRYDKNFNLLSNSVIDDTNIRILFPDSYHGIEDVRLFSFKGNVNGIANLVCIKNNMGWAGYTSNPVSFQIINNVAINPTIWTSPTKRKLDKNWVPLISEDQLYFVYSIDPTVVLKVLDGKGFFVSGNPKANDIKLSGGTPFIELNNHFVSVAHYPRFLHDKLYYRHCFVVMNRNFQIIEVSEPFFFQRPGIEFACGLEFQHGNIYISYGVGDRSAYIAQIPAEELYPRFLTSL